MDIFLCHPVRYACAEVVVVRGLSVRLVGRFIGVQFIEKDTTDVLRIDADVEPVAIGFMRQ